MDEPLPKLDRAAYLAEMRADFERTLQEVADAVVAAKDLNLAAFFAQTATRPSSRPAWQAANQRAGQSGGQLAAGGSEAGSEQAIDPPGRLPDSVMPQSWLDALDELEDDAKTAHDAPSNSPPSPTRRFCT